MEYREGYVGCKLADATVDVGRSAPICKNQEKDYRGGVSELHRGEMN